MENSFALSFFFFNARRHYRRHFISISLRKTTETRTLPAAAAAAAPLAAGLAPKNDAIERWPGGGGPLLRMAACFRSRIVVFFFRFFFFRCFERERNKQKAMAARFDKRVSDNRK